jgi:hypothetical protein
MMHFHCHRLYFAKFLVDYVGSNPGSTGVFLLVSKLCNKFSVCPEIHVLLTVVTKNLDSSQN